MCIRPAPPTRRRQSLPLVISLTHNPPLPPPPPSQNSLALKFYLFIILLSYPWCLEADVLTTPFLLAHLLLVHCCFNVRSGEKPNQEPVEGRRLRRWMWRAATGGSGRPPVGPAAGEGSSSSSGSGSSIGAIFGRRPGLWSDSGADSGGNGTAGISMASSSNAYATGASYVSSPGRSLSRISERDERLSSVAAAPQQAVSSPALASPLSLESGRRLRRRQQQQQPGASGETITSPMSR